MQFIVENKNDIYPKHLVFLRIQYTPIIGSQAICLYQLLLDYSVISNNKLGFSSFFELSAILQISKNDLIQERKKLEAVGLIRVFEKADNKHFIIKINLPLAPNEFRQNSLLFKETISKIGELVFEKLSFAFKPDEYLKDEYLEITQKYQDLFKLKYKITNKENQNTHTIALPSAKNVDEAIKSLNAQQFLNYLTGKLISEFQLRTIQRLTALGFSSQSLNLIIHYSFQVNHSKIVANHINAIAMDMFQKNIISTSSLKLELENAIKSKKNIFKLEDHTKTKRSSGNIVQGNGLDNSDSKNIEDLFSPIGGFENAR